MMYNIKNLLLYILFCFISCVLMAQNSPNTMPQTVLVKDTSAQRDLIDVAKDVFNIKPGKLREEREKKIYFTFLPFSAAPGGTGRALITSTTAGIYLGSRKNTNKSSATFTPYWNFKKRFGLPLRTNIWFPRNAWYIPGDIRFLVYPQYTWGLGSKNDYKERTLVSYKYIRFYQHGLRRIKPYFYAGIGYNLDYHFGISIDDTINLQKFTGYDYGTGRNSLSNGFSLNLLYDSRNNDLNLLPGIYVNAMYRINPGFMGNDKDWRSLYIDVRKYIRVNPNRRNQQNLLALWSYFWTALDEGAPYLDLPSTGWDPHNRSARGIDQNRYRGRSLFYLESEYRRDITRNGLFGFAVFSNINSVSGSGTLFTSWHPAVGAGLRIKFSKVSNTNIAIDYGVSNGFKALILNISEAF